GGARQMMLALGGVKSAALFVLIYMTLRLRRGLGWLAIVITFEIVVGMTGFFFSDFKVTLVVLLCATLSAHSTLRARGIIALAVGAVLSLVLAVFWESGKKDYRLFLNQGTGAQVVLRPLDERLGYLTDKVTEFDSQQFAAGFEQLLARVSYI